MIYKRLSAEQMREVYENQLKKDFAADEVKPFSAIMEMYLKNEYVAFGFYDKEELLAYAYFVCPQNTDSVLLDYFAVVEMHRNKKIGSLCVSLMSEMLKGKKILLETEHPAFFRSAEDNIIRQKRISFYERNGLVKTALHTQVYGVDFLIMQYKKDEMPFFALKKSIEEIYKCMFSPAVYTQRVKIFDLEENNA